MGGAAQFRGDPEVDIWPVWILGLRVSCREHLCTYGQGRQASRKRGPLPSLATHLIVVVHDHQMSEAQGPEQLEHPRERCLLQCGQGLSLPTGPDWLQPRAEAGPTKLRAGRLPSHPP